MAAAPGQPCNIGEKPAVLPYTSIIFIAMQVHQIKRRRKSTLNKIKTQRCYVIPGVYNIVFGIRFMYDESRSIVECTININTVIL